MTSVEPDKVQSAPRDGRDPVRVTADTARQGPDGHRVLYVLLGGLVGAALAWMVLYAFWSS